MSKSKDLASKEEMKQETSELRTKRSSWKEIINFLIEIAKNVISSPHTITFLNMIFLFAIVIMFLDFSKLVLA